MGFEVSRLVARGRHGPGQGTAFTQGAGSRGEHFRNFVVEYVAFVLEGFLLTFTMYMYHPLC